MRHFPIYLDLDGKHVVVAGAGPEALAKLRLILKTGAHVTVVGTDPVPDIAAWAEAGRLTLHQRALSADDLAAATLFYAATGRDAADADAVGMARQTGVPVSSVDNLAASDFITPAIVDRDPVTVAIGTEGTAPVLARKIKADVEAMLPQSTGPIARVASHFRARAATLPQGGPRRAFWSRFFQVGWAAFARDGAAGAKAALEHLYDDAAAGHAARDGMVPASPAPARVAIVGAGPGDPDLLTRRALNLLHEADVIIHDRLVSDAILELARREADFIAVGKTGFGPSWHQDDINAQMIAAARKGQKVLRLKGGDPAIFARLDEEVAALSDAGIAVEVVPGITTASAAAATLGQSLTRRGRNSALRILTGHDIAGFAEADWAGLCQPGSVAAIYMAKRAARFIAGRLLMHGAQAATPVTIIENVSRTNQRVVATTIARLADDLDRMNMTGPAILMLGLSTREAAERAAV